VLPSGRNRGGPPLLLVAARTGISGLTLEHRVKGALGYSLTKHIALHLVEIDLRADAPQLFLNQDSVRDARSAREREGQRESQRTAILLPDGTRRRFAPARGVEQDLRRVHVVRQQMKRGIGVRQASWKRTIGHPTESSIHVLQHRFPIERH